MAVILLLPSISQQVYMVDKIDQLMDFCNKLEKNVEESKKDSELLMQSVFHEAFKEKDSAAGE